MLLHERKLSALTVSRWNIFKISDQMLNIISLKPQMCCIWNGNVSDSDWYIDSGASANLTARKDRITSISSESDVQ